MIPTEPTEQQQQQQQLFPLLSSTPLRSQELSPRDLEEGKKTKEAEDEDVIMSLWDSRASQVTSNRSQSYKRETKFSLKLFTCIMFFHITVSIIWKLRILKDVFKYKFLAFCGK